MPKISIVLPVYNGEAYLDASIKSVLIQTCKDFELIIVDDCSQDRTAAIAKKYAKADSRITYIKNEKNLRLPAALNKGFAKARGKYFSWTSCDNIFLPNALEVMLKELENSREPMLDLVYADMETIDENGNKIGYIQAGPEEDLIIRNVVGACFLYRSDLAKDLGYNEEEFLCEDYDFWLRLNCMSIIKPINTCLYQYRIHQESLSSNYQKVIIAKGIAIQKRYFKLFIRNREMAARYYANLRARDIYNPLRQLYLFKVLFYNPRIFFKEVYNLIKRRFNNEQTN